MIHILKTVTDRQNQLYTQCNLIIEHFTPEPESSEYYAHTFTLKNQNGLFRIAKKTPTKTGWFVTLWKRGADNIIAPYDESDSVDFVVISIVSDHNVGQFIFSKKVLREKNIFSTHNLGGKRGIRVYSPWDTVTSLQAAKTQGWQQSYFVDFSLHPAASALKIKQLYTQEECK